MSTTRKTERSHGAADLLDADEFDAKNVKVRITTFVDLDALTALKKLAKKNAMKYQTLLNRILREYVAEEGSDTGRHKLTEPRVREIVIEELKRARK